MPALPGVTSRSISAPGKRFTRASTAGARTAPGTASSTTSGRVPRPKARSTGTCSASTAPSCVPTRPPPGPGEKSTQNNPGEPADHALGRSQGGFGTKVHLVCDGDGNGLGVVLTAGQRHESVVFESVMDT